MPKNEWSRDVVRRNLYRKINYERGRFGNRRKVSKHNFFWWQRIIVRLGLFKDRGLAKMFGSSTNGIQSLRWRIKNDY